MSARIHSHGLPHTIDDERLIRAFSSLFRVEVLDEQRQLLELYDSFGRDLWRNDLVLCHEQSAGLWVLMGRQDRLLAQQRAPALMPRFWWDFSHKTLRERLEPALGYWSVAPVGGIALRIRGCNLRDDQDKIVARMRWLRAEHGVAAMQALHLQGLRGFSRELTEARAIAAALSAEDVPRDLHDLVRPGPGAPQIKLREGFGLMPGESAEAAVRGMLLRMLDHAGQFEAGILEDRDSEFLHQYRVSLRKARSLLRLMKQVFPERSVQALGKVLAELARPTGPQRDLDVLLLARARYQNWLPDSLHGGVETLFQFVAEDRARAHAQVVKALRAPAHEKRLADLRVRLDRPPALKSPAARAPVAQLAARKIHARYRKIRKQAGLIGPQTPDSDIHELRISCKKLRYLLEFFSEIFDPSPMSELLGPLKTLQDELGAFNDFAVQQAFLGRYAADHRQSATVLAAVGGLVAILHQKHLDARAQAMSGIGAFCAAAIARQIEALCGPHMGEDVA